MRKNQKRALLIAVPVVGALTGAALVVPAMASSTPTTKTRSASLLGGVLGGNSYGGLLAPVKGVLGGMTGGGSGGLLAPVTGILGGVTGGSSGGVLAPVTGILGGVTRGSTTGVLSGLGL